MHATIEELIAMKADLQHPMSIHVMNCEYCKKELLELRSIQSEMLSSAQLPLPTNLWQRIEQTLETVSEVNLVSPSEQDLNEYKKNTQEPKLRFSASTLKLPIYALAASVFLSSIFNVYLHSKSTITDSSLLTTDIHKNIELKQLMQSSMNMENLLQNSASRPLVLQATEKYTLERMNWRLMFIDQQLYDYSNMETPIDPEVSVETSQYAELWRQRIDVLVELNQFYLKHQLPNNEI